MKKRLLYLLPLIALLSGCFTINSETPSSGSTSSSNTSSTTTSSTTSEGPTLSLNKNSLELTVGQQEQLIVSASNGTGSIEWMSSNTSIATVSNAGVVKGIASGNAVITVSFSGLQATCNVTVNPAGKMLSSISINTAPSKTIYVEGEHFDPTGLIINRNYSDSTSDTYSYAGHASDFSFSPTTSTALLTSNTTISISYAGKSCSQTITVHASKTLSSISVTTPPTKTVYVVGECFSPSGLAIRRNYSDSSYDLYTYDSHSSEFSFSPSITTALTALNTSVTITYGGRSCDQAITVCNPSLSLNKSSLDLTTGNTGTITATATGGVGSVSWSSNNTDVATVNNGTVTAVAPGNATITATYSGLYAYCSVSVSNGGSKPTSGTTTITIWSTNDIHGQVDEDGSRAGIGKMMTFLKTQGEQANTLLLDQGDTWQGSIYSNYNHGALITDVMNYIHYDGRSVGNHDFDWGPSYIASNTARSYAGYSTPVLAGNVYDYNMSTHEFGTTQQATLGRKSVVYTLENKVKVGILGGIGEDQITSICTENIKTVGFKNHINFIKEEATRLRTVENCDVVICSLHADQANVIGNEIYNYIDVCLCGHSHDNENYVETDTETGNTTYYSQSGSYTASVGKMTLTFDYSTNKVTDGGFSSYSGYTISSAVSTVDSTIQSIIDSYKSDCNSVANVTVASSVTGSFYSSEQLPNLMCRAIFDECIAEGYNDVLLSYVNDARASLYNSSWTYANLYQAFPFDNVVYIAEITGGEFMYEISRYNYIYRSSSFTSNTINPSATYKVAIIDYLYLHTNSSRYYNYFSTTGGTSTITLAKNYREILRGWLIANHYNTETVLDSESFASGLWVHDRTVFSN